MPNWCNFAVKVKGDEKSLSAFDKIMSNSASSKPVFTQVSLPRILEAERLENFQPNTAIYSGACAWSVHTCMMDSEDSYPVRWRKEDGKGEYSGIRSLPELAKELKLEIEVFSNEWGMNFAEYYLIGSDGDVKVNLTESLMPWPDDLNQFVEFDPTDGVSFRTASGVVPYGVFTI